MIMGVCGEIDMDVWARMIGVVAEDDKTQVSCSGPNSIVVSTSETNEINEIHDGLAVDGPDIDSTPSIEDCDEMVDFAVGMELVNVPAVAVQITEEGVWIANKNIPVFATFHNDAYYFVSESPEALYSIGEGRILELTPRTVITWPSNEMRPIAHYVPRAVLN